VSTITVMIPCYNEAPYIATAISSVVAQTFKDWELVIIDDGSIDGTDWELDQVLAQFPLLPISVYRTEHKGCAHATMQATELATSPLCTILDGDDTLMNDSLQKIVSAFQTHPRVGYIWSRYKARPENGHQWKEGRSKALPLGMSLKAALLKGWWGALAQRSFRRRVYKKTPGLDPSLPYAVDQQLAMLFANLGCEVMHFPEITYCHLQHSKQMSATHRKEQQRCRGEILKRLGGTYVKER